MGLELDQSFASQVKVREQKRKLKPSVKRTHTEPNMHISRKGWCMCLDTCCQDVGGCKCKSCLCHNGEYNHGDVIPDAGTQQREEESEAWQEQSQV
jgi:hypothetical protein